MEQSDHEFGILIQKSANGDTESCKQLYEKMVDKIYSYVRSRTSVRTEAVDITQDVLIDMFSALPNFKYQSCAQFYAYVFVITRRKLARLYADKNIQTGKTHIEFDESIMSTSNKDMVATNDDRLSVLQALDTLDEQTREIVVLHHWSRYTFGEIALLMNMTESAVRVRHHRALRSLAAKLTDT